MGGEYFGKALEEVFADIGFEIDRDVSTEDDVKGSKIGEQFQEVSRFEGDEASQFVIYFPLALGLGKVFVQLEAPGRKLPSGV